MDKISLYEAIFPAFLNNQSPNSTPVGKLGAWKNFSMLLPQTQAAVFSSVDCWIKLKSIILTRNVLLIWVNTRNRAVWTFRSSPTRFQVWYQTNHYFNSYKGTTNVSSKRKTKMRWNKLLKILLKSYPRHVGF